MKRMRTGKKHLVTVESLTLILKKTGLTLSGGKLYVFTAFVLSNH